MRALRRARWRNRPVRRRAPGDDVDPDNVEAAKHPTVADTPPAPPAPRRPIRQRPRRAPGAARPPSDPPADPTAPVDGDPPDVAAVHREASGYRRRLRDVENRARSAPRPRRRARAGRRRTDREQRRHGHPRRRVALIPGLEDLRSDGTLNPDAVRETDRCGPRRAPDLEAPAASQRRRRQPPRRRPQDDRPAATSSRQAKADDERRPAPRAEHHRRHHADPPTRPALRPPGRPASLEWAIEAGKIKRAGADAQQPATIARPSPTAGPRLRRPLTSSSCATRLA